MLLFLAVLLSFASLARAQPATGWTIISSCLPEIILQSLRISAFSKPGPGPRYLLDQPVVREAATGLRFKLIQSGFLPETAVAIQAIAFDKTQTTNWKVPRHQDLMFPFADRVSASDFSLR